MARPLDAEAEAVLAQLKAPGRGLLLLLSRRSGDRTPLLSRQLLPALNRGRSFPGVYLRFADRPARNLRDAFLAVASTALPEPPTRVRLARAGTPPVDGPGSLLALLREARERAGEPLVLLVDRFEELALAPPTPDRDRAEDLLAALLAGEGDCRLVVAMRPSEAAALARLGAGLPAGSLPLPPPSGRLGFAALAWLAASLLVAAAAAALLWARG
jgi:hypothetical protein